MIKDRGNIKWSSLMLTEHRKKLKELLAGEEMVKMPELDEQKLTEMNYLLQRSIHENISVSIGYYQNKKISKLTGKIKDFRPVKREILLITPEGKIRNLSLEKIIEVEVV